MRSSILCPGPLGYLQPKRAVKATLEPGEAIVTLESLPIELKLEVMKNMDPDSVICLTTTSTAYYDAFLDGEKVIAYAIAARAVSIANLPIAVGRYFVSEALWKPDRLLGKTPVGDDQFATLIRELGGLYFDRRASIVRDAIDFKMARGIFEFHQYVAKYTEMLGGRAVKHVPKRRAIRPYRASLALSPTEKARFDKSLYIVEIVSMLFPTRHTDKEIPFWKNFAPWEHTQVRVVESLLSAEFQRALSRLNMSRDCGMSDYHPKTVLPFFSSKLLLHIGLIKFDSALLAPLTSKHWKREDEALAFLNKYQFPNSSLVFKRSRKTAIDAPWALQCWFGLEDSNESNLDGEKMSLPLADIMEEYDDGDDKDNGPRDAWTWRMGRLMDPDFPFLEMFQDSLLRPYSGWKPFVSIFWDRSRLEAVGRQLPKMRDMCSDIEERKRKLSIMLMIMENRGEWKYSGLSY